MAPSAVSHALALLACVEGSLEEVRVRRVVRLRRPAAAAFACSCSKQALHHATIRARCGGRIFGAGQVRWGSAIGAPWNVVRLEGG